MDYFEIYLSLTSSHRIHFDEFQIIKWHVNPYCIEEISDIQRSIQEKSKDLEFIVGKIQTKQNETADKVFRDLNPSVQKILQELIAAKQVKVLLGRENVLFADTSLDLTDDVTSMLDVAAQSE